MHNHIPPTAQAASTETIHDWFHELHEAAQILVGADDASLSRADRAKLQALASVSLDIAESVVTDLNRIATAQEAIAKLLLQADRRGDWP